ncbi:hypothetical protein O181_117508 [Austropuccinia psidii MF-1]|uniref:Uncharacterized protein n=1 Tax=Austropuccinia psidii MF-1 TaxID=1389203 RepID=A0A9Q3KAF5_9BASI|nr:hypothetical protein [Austropuccinia psidii MF-1]
MPIQHSPPARQTRSQARTQAALTLTPRAPLDGTPAVPQLRAKLDRGPILEGRKRAKKIKGPGEDGEEENSTEQTTLAQYNQPVSHQSEPSLLAIMQQMTHIMASECFDRTQPFKVRSFIQSCQLILHNDPANISQYRKKVLYATSFLIGRFAKWIETYLSNLTNQDSNYLLNSWRLFESQLFTLFGDPNEAIKAEAGLDSLRMKEGGHASL